jgi:glycosyltransferase involved in cell wall biosynthesis
MRILTADSYSMNFNLPATVRRSAIRFRFRNIGRVWTAGEALAVYWPRGEYDVLHFMNRIPIWTNKPWVVTFESGLPRIYSDAAYVKRILRERLLSRHCLGVIAMSEWAKMIFECSNAGWDGIADVLAKLSVLHPTIELRQSVPLRLCRGQPIHVVFVGNNFARKGGVVALRLAREAISAGLRVHIHIASAMTFANGAHADHPDPRRYEEDLQGMGLPNVTFYGALPNHRILEIMQQAHIQLLATLHDTYGFSVIEGYSVGVPAITTNVCALPEIVRHDENGWVLDLPRDGRNCWLHLKQVEQCADDSWTILDRTYESLAHQAFQLLARIADHPEQLEKLSQGAIDSVARRHDPQRAACALEEIYGRKAFSQRKLH